MQPRFALPAPVMLSVNVPFAGFYGSIWDDAEDREAERFIEYLPEDPDYAERHFPGLGTAAIRLVEDGKFGELLFDATDYRAMHNHIAREYVVEFAAWFADTLSLPDVAFAFEEMTSPRFYNFETDRLFAKFSITDIRRVFDELLTNHRELLADVIRERFTSYDGFSSYYDNRLDVWLTKPLEAWDHNELGTLLIAWGRRHEVENFDRELYDYRTGGMYEEVYRAFDAAVDWPKLAEAIREAAEVPA